jgi:signal transduction histidine kinase
MLKSPGSSMSMSNRLLIASGFGAAVCTLILVHCWLWPNRLARARLDSCFRERKRICEDLHDGISLELNKITLLSDLGQIEQNQPEQIGRILRSIGAAGRDALDYIRTIIWADNPEFDTLDNLAVYLREKTAGFLEPAFIDCSFDFPSEIPPRKISGDRRKQIVLTFTEALNNLVAHSGATQKSSAWRSKPHSVHRSRAQEGNRS